MTKEFSSSMCTESTLFGIPFLEHKFSFCCIHKRKTTMLNSSTLQLFSPEIKHFLWKCQGIDTSMLSNSEFIIIQSMSYHIGFKLPAAQYIYSHKKNRIITIQRIISPSTRCTGGNDPDQTSRHSFWTLFVFFIMDEPIGSFSPA